MSDEPTCGVLYQAALNEFCQQPEDIRLFAPGFVCGQCEKVYLGACKCAMFRPQPGLRSWLLGVVRKAAAIYGLVVEEFPCDEEGRSEIWIAREGKYLGRWTKYPINSSYWHMARGILCGVPPEEIDFQFHERRGYNLPCDQPSAQQPQSHSP